MQPFSKDASSGGKIARAWLGVCVLFVAIFTTGAQADEAALQAENTALRAEVARLTALLETQSGEMCSGASLNAPATGSNELTLLRKLARQSDEHAKLALGLTDGPLIVPDALLGATIPNEYILLLDGISLQSAAQAAALLGVSEAQILHVYTRALNGFAARLSDEERDRAAQTAGIAGVVQNGYVFASSIRKSVPKIPRANKPLPVQQTQEQSVDVYLFDTGIRAAHRDLEGRVADQGFSFFDNGIAGEDCSGHGTHVAARIAGRTLGVSGSARLVSVKVIDRFGAGDVATVIAGIDWVMAQPGAQKLVNMSLTRLVTQEPSALDIAVERLIADDAIVVVAAGNSAADAQDYSPARVTGAITVGSASLQGLSDFSNAGEGVDIYAPGEAISSASIRDVCGVQEMSGTSMAAPYVTGLIADLLAEGVSADSILANLKDSAERVQTGAFAGELERFVLPQKEIENTPLCAVKN